MVISLLWRVKGLTNNSPTVVFEWVLADKTLGLSVLPGTIFPRFWDLDR